MNVARQIQGGQADSIYLKVSNNLRDTESEPIHIEASFTAISFRNAVGP